MDSPHPNAHSPGQGHKVDFLALNAMLNLYDADGKIQFDKDRLAAREYFLQDVNRRTEFRHNLREKLNYLVSEGYYEQEFLDKYSFNFIKGLYKHLYAQKFRFATFVGAYKFYTGYALKSFDGSTYLERYEDRIAVTALYLADGDEKLARRLADEMINQRYQPATPTFLNAGKKQRGELVSCFLLEIEDDMNVIGRSINSALQLSKRGGGVAFNLTSVRAALDPIKGIKGASSGILPIMKLLEDSFSYANQLGARQGAGAVYLNAHHMDVESFLDCKKEAADEKIRIKTLSLGIVLPDITFELAKNNEEMYLFSPYDVSVKYGKPFADVNLTTVYRELVDDPMIRKAKFPGGARAFFQHLAEVQFESGYPYVMFEDNVNRQNPIHGKVKMSNLCSEILQVSEHSEIDEEQRYTKMGKDISCNLGSLNISRVMDGPSIRNTVETAIRALTHVSDTSDVNVVPSIHQGNQRSHAVGLGQMNLHGYLAREGIDYASKEAVDFVDAYFRTIRYHCIWASTKIAKERGRSFDGFEKSKYYTGEAFADYIAEDYRPKTAKVRKIFEKAGHPLPSAEQWKRLAAHVKKHGMYNQNLQAVAPTGSISYVNHATSSIHPITAKIEMRSEGKMGRVYYPAAHMTDDNQHLFRDAYEIGYKALIDVYAAATRHVDQGLSMTLFFTSDMTTRDLNKAQIYAWQKGIKTMYYVRVKSEVIDGTDMEGCVSCAV
jgi:ribonucleoside-diphosphate reductase alpha chain